MERKSATYRFVPVTLDGQVFLLENEIVQTVCLGDDCLLLPEAATNGLVGQFLQAGEEYPILGLRTLLGQSWPQPELRDHVVVAQFESTICGFLVDDIQRALDVAFSDLTPLPPAAANAHFPYFQAVARLGDVDALVLSHQGFLGMPREDNDLQHLAVASSLLRSNKVHKKLIAFDTWSDEQSDVSISFSASEVLEVIPDRPLLPVPLAGEDCFGLLRWRDYSVPVIDLPRRLGLRSTPTERRRRIAIVRSPEGQLAGFYSDENIRTLRFPIEAEPTKAPAAINDELLVGAFVRSTGQTLLLPSSRSICNSI